MAAPTAPGALCAADNSNPIAIPNTVPNSYPHPDGARRSALLMRSSADNGSSWSAVRTLHDYVYTLTLTLALSLTLTLTLP